MPLENYSRIRLTTNRYESEGVPIGTEGYILEIYDDDAYEVEFLDENNEHITWFSVKQHEVELVEEASSS